MSRTRCDMKVTNVNIYKNMITKKNLVNIDIHILIFNRKDEIEIIRHLIKYTRNFVVVLTDSDESIKIKKNHKHKCSPENIASILHNIFSENKFYEIASPSEDALEKEYIVFIPEQNSERNDNLFNASYRKNTYFNVLTSNLKQFYLYDYYFYNSHAIVRLTDTKNSKCDNINIFENGKIIKTKKVIYAPLNGIGDFLMGLSLMYEYVMRHIENGIKIFFLTIDKDKSVSILKSFFPDQDQIYFDNEAMSNYCLSCENNELLKFYKRQIAETHYPLGCHYIDIAKIILDINSEFYIYSHNEALINNINTAIDAEEKKYIDDFFSNNEYIGFQLFSGTYDKKESTWVVNLDRNWDEDNIRKFVELCNDSNIKLLAFSDHPYSDIKIDQLKKISVLGFIYAVSKVKMLVGIDSAGGHIAAFYNIPSITIWGKQTPIYFPEISKKVSFRPLRKNISIWPNSGCIEKVKAEIVFEKMIEGLNGNIEFSEDITKYNDHTNCFAVD